MTAHPLALVRYRAFNQNGQPLIGGQVFAYEAGSTTSPKDTYSDRSMGTMNTWPVILDDAGSAPIYISGDYFFQVFDADGNLIEEGDGIADAESIAQALIEGTSGSAAIIEQRVADLETARDEHTDQINDLIDDTTNLRSDLNKEVETDRNAAITAAINTLEASLTAEFEDQLADVNAKVEDNTNNKFDKTGGTITGEVTLQSKLNLGTSSLAGKNGHTYLPNGYIYQFGYIALSDMTQIPSGNPYEHYAVIDLPKTFPVEALNPNAIVKATNTGYLSDVFAQVVSSTTTHITVKTCTVSSSDVSDGIDGVYWSVIGH